MKNITKTTLGKVFTVANLAGGLNKKTSSYDLENNEALGLVNYIFTESKILRSRPGYKKYNSSEISSATGIYGLYRFYKKDGSSKYFVCATSTNLYYDNSTTWTALTCDVTLTADQTFRFAVLNDLLLMTNGANKPLKWLGGSSNNVKQIGIVAPASGSTAEDGGSSGNLSSGKYYWKITYYNSTTGELTESSASSAFPTSGLTLAASHKASLASIPRSTDSQVDYIRIYRTTAGGSTYYYVTAIANPSSGTGSYTDNNSDTTIQANASFSASSNDPPPTDAKYITIAKNRVFLFNNSSYKSRLYWSEVDSPEYWGSGENYIDVNADDGDVGTGIIPFGDYLYIFKENSTYCLTDPSDPANNSFVREISKDLGCISPDTLCTGQFKRPISKGDYILVSGIILNTRFGVMGFDGTQFWPLSERVEPILDKLYQTNIQNMVGFFNKNKYDLAYTPKEGTIQTGGYVSYNQYTTNVGDEHKDATWEENHDAKSYNPNKDARIDLTNTSAENENVIVNLAFKWNIGSEIIKYHKGINFEFNPRVVFYEIFFSYNNGSNWTSKGTFRQEDKTERELTFCQHTFNDSSVTNIRLDYYIKFNVYGNIKFSINPVDYIRLVNAEYWYKHTTDVNSNNVINNKILYYDSLHNAWAEKWGIKANCFCAWNGSGDEGEEYFGSSDSGYVYRMNVGSDDDGSDIFAMYQSKYFDCEDRARKKRFHSLSLSTDIFSADINVDVFIDRVQVATFKFNLMPQGVYTNYYNEKYFGEAVFDRIINLINKSLRLPSKALGKYISIRLWTSGKESMAIKDYSFRYVEREGFR